LGTSKPYSDTAEVPILLGMLTLHSAERDRALGLPRPGARTLSLLAYRRKQEQEITRTVTVAMFLKSLVAECQKEIHRLVDGADTSEKRREILPEVERLKEVAQMANARLENLSNG